MDPVFRSPSHPLSPHVRRLLAAKGIRAFGDGYVSLLLPVYLLERGYAPLEVGLLATATMLGSGLLTLVVGWRANRFSYRTLLLAASVLMAATGLGFAFAHDFWLLLLIAVVGTLNPSSGDVSVFLPLEHAVLSHVASDSQRTRVFARYSLAGAVCVAFGSLASAIPAWLAAGAGVSSTAALQAMFVLYALLALVAAAIYRTLPLDLGPDPRRHAPPLGQSRGKVLTLAALFSVDAFAGGLIVQSLLALWLYQRFALSVGMAASLFFWTGLLAAGSYLVAARIADRFGLVNTMVFTHIPSSLCLIAIAFVPALWQAIVLLLVRAALSQMDVPTRSSYVMAIVSPGERAAAASVTTVPRSLAAAASPVLAGSLLGASTFGWPLVIAGVLKIAYDLLLLARFGRVRPPEEEARRMANAASAKSGARPR